MNSWRKDIDRATSEAEVIARARDFCSLVHPRDLAPLPEDCRQIRIDNDRDIALLRERLAQGYLRVHAGPAEVARLEDLLGYLTHAARLGELRKTQ